MKSRGVAALTLVEMLVAVSVLSVVLVAALAMFVPALHHFQEEDVAYDTQRWLAVTLNQMGVDLRETNSKWLQTPFGNPPPVPSVVAAIPTARDGSGSYLWQPDGTPLWSGWIVYWEAIDADLPGAHKLLRQYVHRVPPAPIVAADLSAFKARLMAVESGVSVRPVRSPAGLNGAYVQLTTLASYQSRLTNFSGDETIELPF